MIKAGSDALISQHSHSSTLTGMPHCHIFIGTNSIFYMLPRHVSQSYAICPFVGVVGPGGLKPKLLNTSIPTKWTLHLSPFSLLKWLQWFRCWSVLVSGNDHMWPTPAPNVVWLAVQWLPNTPLRPVHLKRGLLHALNCDWHPPTQLGSSHSSTACSLSSQPTSQVSHHPCPREVTTKTADGY